MRPQFVRFLRLLSLASLAVIGTADGFAAPGTISATVSPPGPVLVGENIEVTLRISGYSDQAEVDGYNFNVSYPAGIFSFVAGSIGLGDAVGPNQQWLSKANQESVAAGYTLTDFTDGSVPGLVGVSVSDLGVSVTERGTLATDGYLISFKLTATAPGQAVITPFATAGGSVLFDTELRPVGVPLFARATIVVTNISAPPPTISCPSNITVWGCSNLAPVSYTVTATTLCPAGAGVTVTCVPPSGSLFPLGDTTVTCTARDPCGGSNSCTFIVRVIRDTVPPVIVCPSNIVVWTCDPSGRNVPYSVSATDDCDTNVTLVCTPIAPGGLFPIGDTPITCRAVDDCGNGSSCTFIVRVIRDTTPPDIRCPSNLLVRTTGNGTNVSFTVTATDDCDTNVTLTCVPPSGSFFPVGNTVVTCTAIDDCGNSNRCTFIVRVRRTPTTHLAVADYLRTEVLGGSLDGVTLWMTPMALDPTHVARDLDPRVPDMPLPYPASWLVMIDDQPEANFGHRCRWLVVDDDLTMHTQPMAKQFPPTVWGGGGSGPQVPFACASVTPAACPSLSISVVTNIFLYPNGKGCLKAVLVSGGINSSANYSRYRQNLQSMYQILRACGFQKSSIWVYYADGSPLDLDNLDGDGNNATGSDVNGAVTEANIRTRIQVLCDTLNPNRDVLLIYTSNHGADNAGLCLWDFNNNGNLEAAEIYSPAEFAADTADCRVCRLFGIFDQCFAGEFSAIATDGAHPKSAFYAAAIASEPSWGREYMMYWETIDPATTDINDMHASVTASMALVGHATAFAQGMAGNGDVRLCRCWTYLIPGLVASKLQLVFESELGIIYDIECTENLERPDWRVIQSYPGTGAMIEHFESLGFNRRFYRIRER